MLNFNVNVNSDAYSFDKNILRKIRILVDSGVEKGLSETAVELKSEILRQALYYNIPDSALDGLSVEVVSDGISVAAKGDSLMFIEYGTGVVGSGKPHPDPPTGWSYDVNVHGETGWWYPTTSSDRNPTKKELDDGSIVAWTKGVESKPFMYKSWLWAYDNFNDILTRSIYDELKKL